jgi:hypothetical protein
MCDTHLTMCAGRGLSESEGCMPEPFYALAEIQNNNLQQQLAVAREDYAAAARLKKTTQALRERDEFTRLSLQLDQATAEQRFEEAAALRDLLVAATLSRSAQPHPLNRLLLLTSERTLATCRPDGTDHAPLSVEGTGSTRRYAQPMWSPSGDMVAAVSYTGTALSSTVDAKHHLVVLQARDSKAVLEELVDFPPFHLQWAGSGCSLCYLSRSLRARAQLVTIDVLARAASSTAGSAASGTRSTRDTVRSRVLREGDLLFFTHQDTACGGRGAPPSAAASQQVQPHTHTKRSHLCTLTPNPQAAADDATLPFFL